MNRTSDELRHQWANPSDILSLLLLIGSDIVQKAIAQLVGHKIHLPGRKTPGLSIAPVAFSFGWAAYAFSNLLASVGDMRLMPTSESPSIVVNCSNGFVRENRSWALSRLLRDHEIRYEVDPRLKDEGGRAESIRIDVFNLGSASGPDLDFVWCFGWLTILVQIAIAVLPLALYDDWGILIVTLCGNLLAAVTCAIPQWTQEKWVGPRLERDKVTCLTRGNGHLHIMVFIGRQGSWDIERYATSVLVPRLETRWISLVLAILWTCILISVSGLRQHTWFLIGIGGIGMLQNLFAAGTPRKPGASNFHITEFSRAPTIIGRREDYKDDADANVNLDEDLQKLDDISTWVSQKPKLPVSENTNTTPTETFPMPRWLASMSKEDGIPSWLEPLKPNSMKQAGGSTQSAFSAPRSSVQKWFNADVKERDSIIYAIGVHGALIELEKWVPTAGLAMIQIFFQAGLQYNNESIRDNVHKKFWKRAYRTRSIRERAEKKRRVQEREYQVQVGV